MRPNILWILTTQWRAASVGYGGNSGVRTPNLDAFATRSVNYAQAVSPHPFGPFARAALLTGVRSPDNGVRDYYDPLPPEAVTVASELAGCGYATGFMGKWHLARRDPHVPLVGEAHARMCVPAASRGGFEFWEGFEGGFLLNDPWLHGSRLPEPVQFAGYQSDVLCDRMADWIEAAPQPWFAVLSLEAPHPPYDAPAAGTLPGSVSLPANVPAGAAARARRELSGYHAHIEATDRSIGRLFARIPDAARTVFTSVHGDMHGAHGLFRKGWPYEESIRVPMLVHGDGPRGVQSQEPVSLLDLHAMTLAWAEGRAWRCPGEHADISMPSVVALPDQCDRRWSGVRTRSRKLVLNDDGSPWLYFDLERDPLEQHNLVGRSECADEIAALSRTVARD